MIDEKLMRLDTEFGNIAQSIRKNYMTPTETQYKPSEMAQGIEDMANNIKDTLYNYLPTKIVTDGMCKNAVALPVKEIDVSGNNEQETTEGYNRLDLQDTTISKNDVTATVKKGVITLNGTPTANTTLFIPVKDLIKEKVSANVPFYFFIEKNNSARIDFQLDFYDGTNYTQYQIGSNTAIGVVNKEITVTEDKYLRGISLYVISGTVYSNVIVKPMVTDAQKTIFEPYTNGVATPNTEYKQDIEVIDGVNRFDKNNVEIGALSSDGTNNGDTNYVISNFIKGNNTFTFLYDNLPTDHYIRIGYYDDKKTFIKRDLIEIEATAKKYTFNTTYPYIKISVQNNSINTYQIVEGTSEKPYLPYGHIGLVQRGKNYCNAINQNYYLNTYVDGCGNITGNNGLIIPINDNTKMTISSQVVQARFRVACINELPTLGAGTNVVAYNGVNLDNNSTIKTTINTTGYKYLVVNATDLTVIQIEQGSIATDYEPYHEPIVHSIDLAGEKLAKVGEIADLLKIARNGSAKIGNKVIKEYVFTGDENWQVDSNTQGLFRAYLEDANLFSMANSSTNSFLVNRLQKVEGNIGSYNTDKETLAIRDSLTGFQITLKNITSIDEFKQWLKDNSTYVLYQTKQAETINLPSIEPITLFEGTNVFELITNLGTTFTVEYVVDKNTILDGVQTALLDAEPEI